MCTNKEEFDKLKEEDNNKVVASTLVIVIRVQLSTGWTRFFHSNFA